MLSESQQPTSVHLEANKQSETERLALTGAKVVMKTPYSVQCDVRLLMWSLAGQWTSWDLIYIHFVITLSMDNT